MFAGVLECQMFAKTLAVLMVVFFGALDTFLSLRFRFVVRRASYGSSRVGGYATSSRAQ
jgi:hypothetical protein